MAFSNDNDVTHYKEINYYIQYAGRGFSIGVWDLFNTRGVSAPDVWDYDKNTTGHLLDLRTSFNLGEAFPLTLETDILFYGKNDAQISGSDFKQRYSTYLQFTYSLVNNTRVDLDAFVGFGFSLNGETHLYGNTQNRFDIVNLGVKAYKDVKLMDLSIPVSVSTLWNPSKKIARVQLAVGLF